MRRHLCLSLRVVCLSSVSSLPCGGVPYTRRLTAPCGGGGGAAAAAPLCNPALWLAVWLVGWLGGRLTD